jgi:hypothetical protein
MTTPQLLDDDTTTSLASDGLTGYGFPTEFGGGGDLDG